MTDRSTVAGGNNPAGGGGGRDHLDAASGGGAASVSLRLGAARSDRYGEYLTDGNGRALYLLEGGSGCEDACMSVWPPLFAGPSPLQAPTPVRPGRGGVTTRPGGARQATYGGHPLYCYVGDHGPGETAGQHVEDS